MCHEAPRRYSRGGQAAHCPDGDAENGGTNELMKYDVKQSFNILIYQEICKPVDSNGVKKSDTINAGIAESLGEKQGNICRTDSRGKKNIFFE